MSFKIIVCGIITGLLLTNSSVLAQTDQADPNRVQHPDLPYTVIEGKVDHSTFLGWRVFHSTCYICHGVDATGTSVAPDLTERVQAMSAEDFAIAVLYRYPIITGFNVSPGDDLKALREKFLEDIKQRENGGLNMPTWEHDLNVRPHIFDLYAYLRARADGALGEGRPEQFE